jgi:hypothetical protein
VERQIINPWRWGDGCDRGQPGEIDGVRRMLIREGPASVDAEAGPSDADDRGAELEAAEPP